VIYNQFDIVSVPFPFTDSACIKKRPALIVSTYRYVLEHAHYILLMITSAKQSQWPGDIDILNLDLAGLPKASKIRFKLFSLDCRIVLNNLGKLDKIGIQKVLDGLSVYLWSTP